MISPQVAEKGYFIYDTKENCMKKMHLMKDNLFQTKYLIKPQKCK